MLPSCLQRATRRVLSVASVFVFCSIAASAAVVYDVTVDTSAFAGSSGYLDFQFNQSGQAQEATADVTNFSSVGGSLNGAPVMTGSVSGALPGTVSFVNSGTFNDYLHAFTFGSSFLFRLRLDGDAINSPSGQFPTETVFALSLFNSGFEPIGPSDPVLGNGFVTIGVNGSVVPQAAGPNPIVSFQLVNEEVPEPSSWILSLGALCALVAVPRIRGTLGGARS